MLDARPVTGTFRTLRWWANAILMAILLGTPWIRIGGEPLILLDIPARKFHVFGLVIFPQELLFLWVIIAALAIALFFFTALAGRLWCGWACPQTVFTDVFAAVARRIQGWKGTKRPVRVAAWRVVATHVAWLAISAVVGFHLVGYFISPYVLIEDLVRNGTWHPTALGFLIAAALLAYFDFAIVRQVFCKYLCPYARFQSVLFDRDTLVVAYDEARGEPRGKASKRPGLGVAARGDCVDCGLCVAVCPTQIDIRKGLQMECIACTQCIDACNGVMARLGRAANLIGYRSQVGLEGVRPVRPLRPRVLVYGAILVALMLGFGAMLQQRMPMDLHVAHNRANLYTRSADGRVGNAFTLHIENRDRNDHSYQIRLSDEEAFELVTGMNPIRIPAISAAETRVFVLARNDDVSSRDIDFVLEPLDDGGRRLVRRARFMTPGGVSHEN